MKIKTIIICLFVFIIFSGCKPDNLEIEIYTSDIIDAVSDGEVGEVPLKATFKIMGEDKENQLSKAKKIALKYMPNDSEIEISKGTFGKVMTIVSSIPIGSDSKVKKFLQQNPRIAMVVVGKEEWGDFELGVVTLKPTKTLAILDKELSKINFMLGVELPAGNTAFRIVSDSKGKVDVLATAVFSEKKPYLNFEKVIKKRKSVVIDFKGGDGSVYSEIEPVFYIKL